MLLINSSAFYVIGVDAEPETVECILADLSGKVMERTVNNIDTPITNEHFLSILKEGIHHILEVSDLTHENILGIGFVMHGVVDLETVTFLFVANLSVTDFRIKD